MSLNISKFGIFIKRQYSNAKTFYTKNHEWIRIINCDDNDNHPIRAKIGISEYSQKALGEIVFIEMPKVETRYNSEGFYKFNHSFF